jgi:hypothetical protein
MPNLLRQYFVLFIKMPIQAKLTVIVVTGPAMPGSSIMSEHRFYQGKSVLEYLTVLFRVLW